MKKKLIASTLAALTLGVVASVNAGGNGAIHTFDTVSDEGCQDGLTGLKYCWESSGVVTAKYAPSGNVIGKVVTHTYNKVYLYDVLIQEGPEIEELQGIYKDGEPFVWKSDRSSTICVVDPFTGLEGKSIWKYRYANGEFRRMYFGEDTNACED